MPSKKDALKQLRELRAGGGKRSQQYEVKESGRIVEEVTTSVVFKGAGTVLRLMRTSTGSCVRPDGMTTLWWMTRVAMVVGTSMTGRSCGMR